MSRDFDLVIFGASGFVGRLVVEEMRRRLGDSELRWAIAGRDAARLEALRAELGLTALPILLAGADDTQSLQKLAARSRVICTTVGPYARLGSELLGACAQAGTHYCDITGEVHWVRAMLDAHAEHASDSGARLVHCCGFDSIPSDLGCLMLQQAMQARHGSRCREIRFILRKARGGFSGGTVASLLNLVEAARDDRALRRLLADPYALCPADAHRGPGPADPSSARWDELAQSWTAPFLMGPVNSRIVHRSNALLDDAYGADFRYSEVVSTGRGLRARLTASALSGGLKGFMAAAAMGPTRRFMQRRFLPAPGEGPSASKREAGNFDIRFIGLAEDGQRLDARVTGDRDPGYGATARMLTECALSLARDEVRDSVGGGSWTPASCFGADLIERLQAEAGMRFSIDE